MKERSAQQVQTTCEVNLEIDKFQSSFYKTKNSFQAFCQCEFPLSYTEWCNLRSDYKVAALYVQFFDQITLAWYKCRSYYTEEEDGVSIVLQYLNKNVPIIEKDEHRFRSNYIYRVAYNCMYCICHDVKRDKDRWNYQISNIQESSEGEFDLFDTLYKEKPDIDEEVHAESVSNMFWEDVRSLGDNAVRYVEYLLGREKPGIRVMKHEDEIIQELQSIFQKYRKYYNI